MASQWYYTPDGRKRLGPFSLEQMKALARSRQLQPAHMARRDEMKQWVPAGTIAELFPPTPAAASGQQPDPISSHGPAAPPHARQKRSFLLALRAATASGLSAAWSVLQAPWQEGYRRASLVGLRRRLRKRRREEARLLADLGVRLLGAGVAVPGCEALSERLGRLARDQLLALQAPQRGRVKRQTATRLRAELHALYAEFGRRGLSSGVPFDGRAEQEARWHLTHVAVANAEAAVDLRTTPVAGRPPATRRRVLCGLAGATALACLLVGLVCWGVGAVSKESQRPSEPSVAAPPTPPSASSTRPGPQTASAPAEVKKAPARRALQELFLHLAPAVPLVDAVGSGTGSGFLIRSGGKYLVVTNRHVIENARRGVAVHFLLADEKRFTLPPSKTSVVGIHRAADLAVVDVSGAAEEIDKLHIEPVRLAPAGHRPNVGEHVFAIGHPGGAGDRLLTRTLSDGIVSAVGRQEFGASFLQVTVPLNPGNSGGPLFDDEGRVVGVNTFIIRRGRGQDVTLEALNFALEGKFVHEILTEPGKSLDGRAIAALLNPPQQQQPQTLAAATQATVRRYLAAGYRFVGGSMRDSTRAVRLEPGGRQEFTLRGRQGVVYGVAALSQGEEDIDLAVVDATGRVLAKDLRYDPDAEVVFRAGVAGNYSVIVMNASAREAGAVVVFFER